MSLDEGGAGPRDCSRCHSQHHSFSHPNNEISLAPHSLAIYKDTLLGVSEQLKEKAEFEKC